MIRLSPGLASNVLGDYGLARMLGFGVIEVYSGSPPPYAHWAPTGTRLARVTRDGGAFQAGDPTYGLPLDRSQPGALRDTGNWVLTGVADGRAGWWRWRWFLDDPGTTDPYYPRLDGVVNDSLFLPTKTITAGLVIPVDQFYLTFGS